MSFLSQKDPGEGFEPFLVLEQSLGYIPNLLRAQSLLPCLVEAQTRLLRTMLLEPGALDRRGKERLLLMLAASQGSHYCVGIHAQSLASLGVGDAEIQRLIEAPETADLGRAEGALLDFCRRRAGGLAASTEEIESLRQYGIRDETILEAIAISALSRYLCTLAHGLGVAPDFEPRTWNPPAVASLEGPGEGGVPTTTGGCPGFLHAGEQSTEPFAAFEALRAGFGFVPNLYRAQMLRPDLVEVEAALLDAVLMTDTPLDRVRKESILLAASAAARNSYGVAIHGETLKNLGIPEEDSDRIAQNPGQAALSESDRMLLNCAVRLALPSGDFTENDIRALRASGFSEPEILSGIATASLAAFLDTLQKGLGSPPDFEPRVRFPEETGGKGGFSATTTAAAASNSTGEVGPAVEDEDLAHVRRIQAGEIDAFEVLVAKHKGRLYQTILGITGRSEDAEDGTQEALVKAYQHLGDFQGNSKFSTWLTRIAINEGLMILRRRKEEVSLDEGVPEEDDFRPRQLQVWGDDPEELTSRGEIRRLMEREILKLPERYRAVVVLRDLSGLSTEEAAKALGLGIPALKTRLFRGHLLLREALAPHFTQRQRGMDDA